MRPRRQNRVPASVAHDAAEKVKTVYWVERLRRLGPVESLRVADELRHHVRALRPDWPGPLDREADLAVHLTVGEALRRVRRNSI